SWDRLVCSVRVVGSGGFAAQLSLPFPSAFHKEKPMAHLRNHCAWRCDSAVDPRVRDRYVSGMPSLRILADGLEFPEGPVLLGRDRIAFVQIRGQRVSLYEHGAVRTIAVTGGGPNGATLGADGALYVANNGGLSLGPAGRWMAEEQIPGRIQRITMNGETTDL